MKSYFNCFSNLNVNLNVNLKDIQRKEILFDEIFTVLKKSLEGLSLPVNFKKFNLDCY